MHARTPARPNTTHRATVWLLLLALVLAPLLGQVHRTLHGASASAASFTHVAGVGPEVLAVDHLAHSGHGLERLFGSHDSAGDCRLYDQLGHADGAACVPALALPVVLPAFFFTTLQGDFVARFAALFDARGPPSLR
jgi:hypothetical protein